MNVRNHVPPSPRSGHPSQVPWLLRLKQTQARCPHYLWWYCQLYVPFIPLVGPSSLICRPCWVNFCLQMYQHLSCCSWSRVCPLSLQQIASLKFGIQVLVSLKEKPTLDFGLASSVRRPSISSGSSLTTCSLKLLSHPIRDLPALGKRIGNKIFYPVLIYTKATVAEKHGQRTVLLISLIGSAATCFLFGTSTSMNEALVIRLLQGTFAGAMGVARGTVAVITDQTNEGRAWAVLG